MDPRDRHSLLGSFTFGQAHHGIAPAAPNPPPVPPPVHLSFGAAPKPLAEAHGSTVYNGDGIAELGPGGVGGFGGGEPARKKRGRPRKYGPDGNLTPTAVKQVPDGNLTTAAGFSVSGYAESQQTGESASAKKRGRPPGSGKKQQLEALGPSGSDFIPHVLIVNPGENVASKIMAFSQQGPRTVCIISASGVVSNVALRQPATCGGTVTYEGRFEILSLSGSYMLTENGDTRSRTGGLSVSLGGSDGRVLGGGVVGALTAATTVQVVVGSFLAEGKKRKLNPSSSDPSLVPRPIPAIGEHHPGSPHSQGSASESSDKDDHDDDDDSSPFHQHDSGFNGSGQHSHLLNPSAYNILGWSHQLNQPRK